METNTNPIAPRSPPGRVLNFYKISNLIWAREHVHLLVGVASVSPSVIAARLFPDAPPLELAAATNLASVSMRSLLIRMVQDVVAQGLL